MRQRFLTISHVTAIAAAFTVSACGPAEQTSVDPSTTVGTFDAGLSAAQVRLLRVSLIYGHYLAHEEYLALGHAEGLAVMGQNPADAFVAVAAPNPAAAPPQALVDAVDSYADRLRESPPDVVIEAARADIETQVSAAWAQGSVEDHAEALSGLMEALTQFYEGGVRDGVIIERHRMSDAWGCLRAAALQFETRRAEFDAIDPDAARMVADRLDDVMAAFPDITTETPPEPTRIRVLANQVSLALLAFR